MRILSSKASILYELNKTSTDLDIKINFHHVITMTLFCKFDPNYTIPPSTFRKNLKFSFTRKNINTNLYLKL